MANFWISSLRRFCSVGVDVSCSGFMEAGSKRSLGLRHMANSTCILPLEVTCVFLTVAALRINWAGLICARVVWSRFLEAASTSAKRNFLNNRPPISARFGRPKSMRPCRKSLHVVHSIECLHVMRLVEGHIPTIRLRVLESVHPLIKLSNDFRWRGTLAWLLNVMWLHPTQSEIQRFCLRSLPIHGPA